jgi:hypothetical protein
MTPYVLELVEKLRSGEMSGSAFQVVRDAAWEAGCRLRVTNGRKVNIKKSNRPSKLRGISAAIANTPYDILLDRQDRADAELLAAAINAPPSTAGRFARAMQAITFTSPFTGEQPSYHVPIDTDFFQPENGFGYFGQEWDSERIFRELKLEGETTITMTGTPYDINDGDWLQVGEQRFGAGALRQWAQVAAVDPARRTITITRPDTTRQSVAMSLRRNSKRAPDPRARPSRVPEKLQKRRLDGRRR